ncbi:predicted protein [Histoplasma capsulatum var. duboisii H88]|uniref:Predicted protein n=1 Tax=Ajellomyces capsulatus (strain H88) TaxID=544711 RepID=F0UCG2_AJEC8|nr:predicted protein [Histoplasma capsulatum var. duboisii H88]
MPTTQIRASIGISKLQSHFGAFPLLDKLYTILPDAIRDCDGLSLRYVYSPDCMEEAYKVVWHKPGDFSFDYLHLGRGAFGGIVLQACQRISRVYLSEINSFDLVLFASLQTNSPASSIYCWAKLKSPTAARSRFKPPSHADMHLFYGHGPSLSNASSSPREISNSSRSGYFLAGFGDSSGSNIPKIRQVFSREECGPNGFVLSHPMWAAVIDIDEAQRVSNIKWARSPVADLKTQPTVKCCWMIKEITWTLTDQDVSPKFTILSASFTLWDISRSFEQTMQAAKGSVLSLLSISMNPKREIWIANYMELIVI